MGKHKNQDEEIWGGPEGYQAMNHIGLFYILGWLFWILLIILLEIVSQANG